MTPAQAERMEAVAKDIEARLERYAHARPTTDVPRWH